MLQCQIVLQYCSVRVPYSGTVLCDLQCLAALQCQRVLCDLQCLAALQCQSASGGTGTCHPDHRQQKRRSCVASLASPKFDLHPYESETNFKKHIDSFHVNINLLINLPLFHLFLFTNVFVWCGSSKKLLFLEKNSYFGLKRKKS